MSPTHTHVNDSQHEDSTQSPSSDAMEIGSVDYDNWFETISKLAEAGDAEYAVKQATELAARLPGVHAAVGFKRTENMPLVPVTSLICRSGIEDEVAKWQSQLAPNIRELCSQQAGYHTASLDNGIELISVALGSPYQPMAVICIFADTLIESSDSLTLCMQLLSVEGGSWFYTDDSATTRLAPGIGTTSGLWECCEAGTADESLALLADRLSCHLQNQMVILGTVVGRRSKCRVESISGTSKLTRASQLTANAEELMSEAVIRGEFRIVDAVSSDIQRTEAEEQLFRLCSATQIISGPLDSRGETRGALVLVVQPAAESVAPVRDIDWIGKLNQLAPAAGGCVDILQRAKPTYWQRMQHAMTSQDYRDKRRNVAIISAVLVALLAVPIPYRISCRAEVQPLTRRFVPAPYEGILDEVLVEPGDVVKQGQILARMDAREIQWQLSAARAELKRFSKEQDSATAARDTSAAQVAELQMQSTQVEIDMLRNRMNNLEIKCPIDGVILGGDPKKMEGARLSLGQTLFETGPLKDMILEVRIPDREVSYVSAGNTVRTRLDAFPHRGLMGQVVRVAPQAEMKEQENVFVAEVLMENQRGLLRPGMAGWARVSAGVHPLGWNLFHHAVDNLRYWIGI